MQKNKTNTQSETAGVRLQKILADAGIASRRAAEELILGGSVKVNGATVVKLGTRAFPDKDKITVNGKPIWTPKKVLYVFHKPRGVITSMSDPEGRVCVGDYVKNLAFRVYPVGRLDFNVSGLLLLTNDGELAQKISHPNFGIKRKYLARVKGELTKNRAKVLTKGIAIKPSPNDKYSKNKEAAFGKVVSVEQIPESKYTKDLVGEIKEPEILLEVVVAEGRNHFVKNILNTVGLPVTKLSRLEFGPYKLESLKSGCIRQMPIKKEILIK